MVFIFQTSHDTSSKLWAFQDASVTLHLPWEKHFTKQGSYLLIRAFMLITRKTEKYVHFIFGFVLYVPDTTDFFPHLKCTVIFHISIFLHGIQPPASTFIMTIKTVYNLNLEHTSNFISYHSPSHSLYAKDNRFLKLFHLLIPSSSCIL